MYGRGLWYLIGFLCLGWFVLFIDISNSYNSLFLYKFIFIIILFIIFSCGLLYFFSIKGWLDEKKINDLYKSLIGNNLGILGLVSLTVLLLIFLSQSSVDICKCLTEAGNSEYMQKNGDACRDAISKELGVDNWEKVNFSKNANLSAKFDALENKCK